MHTQQRQQRTYLAVVLAVVLASFFSCRVAANAATAAGTAITNVANVVYTTAEGTFTGTSNTLTIYVQNAPSLTVVPGGAQSITPSMIVVDTFTLTNTGNNTAASNVFSLDAVAAFSGTGSPTLLGYTLTGSTCIVTAPCGTIGAENALAGMTGAGPITVGVVYQLSSAATVGQTVITTLHAQLTYATIAGQVAATSVDTTGAETDTSMVDARLDVQTSVVSPGSVGANIVWTVKANNGGGNPALGLASAKAALSNAPGGVGVVLFVPVPTFSAAPLALQGAPTLTPGTLSSGATAAMWYNLAQCSTAPTGGWSTTYNSADGCMAVYVSGGTTLNQELPSVTGGSSGAGTSAGTPQITLSFTTAPPGPAGGGVANSVSLIATGAVGGVVWASEAVTPIVGQGVTMGTADAATNTLLNAIQTNTTPSSGIIAPGGASNSTGSQAFAAYSILIGPLGTPTATGAWSAGVFGYTSASSTNLNDFTFIDSGPLASTNLGTAPGSLPVGAAGLTPTGAVTIKGTVQNAGNITDSATLTATAISNWTVAFYCLNGASVTCGGGSANTCYTTPITVTGSILGTATYGICATFTPSSTVTGLAPLDWTITATSVGNVAVSNATHDVLYPGGVLVSFRSSVVTGPGTCSTVLVTGCTITYSVTLVNEAPVPTAAGGVGNISVTPSGNAVVSENGTTGGNTWGTNSLNGLTGVPTFVSCTGCSTTGVATSQSFTVTIPNTDLGPQQTVTYTYAVVVQ